MAASATPSAAIGGVTPTPLATMTTHPGIVASHVGSSVNLTSCSTSTRASACGLGDERASAVEESLIESAQVTASRR